MRTVPVQAPQRPDFRDSYRYYGNAERLRSSAQVYDFPTVQRTGVQHKKPTAQPLPTVQPKVKKKTAPIVMFFRILFAVGLCMLMLYRYANILESNDKIDKLTAQLAEIEAKNQSIQAKIDRGLELGTLEEYATGQLGMIRPDSSQMFYIDMQMGDAAPTAKEETDTAGNALQGTPGALVHAIRVLK